MRWFLAMLTIAALAYAATGVYTVGTDQRALVRRFGRVIGEQAKPGLHFGLPWRLDRVDLMKPTEIKAVTVGGAGSVERLAGGAPADARAQFLTGDQNLVNVQATVQYTIHNSQQYLLGSAEPARIIMRAAESAVTATLADQSIDTILTSGKSALAILIQQRLQDRLDAYGVGAEVHSVNLTELAPPPQLADAFNRATGARSDRERLVLEAKTYGNEKLAQAQSEARETIDKAKADHARSVDLARSDADRFRALVYEYNKAPGVTLTRLYLETMAEIIPRFRSKIIIDSGPGVDVMIMRNEP